MTLRKLGPSNLNITRIGIGAWAIGGGKWEFGWGPQDDEESIAAIRAGLDRGLNWIDTAAAYGLWHSEIVVGRAVHGLRTPPLYLHEVQPRVGPVRQHFPQSASCVDSPGSRSQPQAAWGRCDRPLSDPLARVEGRPGIGLTGLDRRGR